MVISCRGYKRQPWSANQSPTYTFAADSDTLLYVFLFSRDPLPWLFRLRSRVPTPPGWQCLAGEHSSDDIASCKCGERLIGDRAGSVVILSSMESELPLEDVTRGLWWIRGVQDTCSLSKDVASQLRILKRQGCIFHSF